MDRRGGYANQGAQNKNAEDIIELRRHMLNGFHCLAAHDLIADLECLDDLLF